MLKRDDLTPALCRPGMYAGAQDGRKMHEWQADAVVAYLGDVVPNAKVRELADNIQQMMALEKEKVATIATMIEECVRRIEVARNGHWDIEDQRKANHKRAEAIAGLKQMAVQLRTNS